MAHSLLAASATLAFAILQYTASGFAAPASHHWLRWFLHLGGIGLIPLGILDGSPFPVPGSMDLATVVLAARDRDLWFYYALMASVGSVLGGFLTYRLARKGGKAALEKKFPRYFKKIERAFERWGFAAIAVPALLPPPCPMAPFLIAAGSAQYPVTKFLIGFSAGRLVRFFILALLAVRYGRSILAWFAHHYVAILIAGVTLAVASTVIALLFRERRARKSA